LDRRTELSRNAKDESVNPEAGFATLTAEYRTVAAGLAIVDRSCRWLLEVEGADRVEWLHNLTSNQVKMLSPGEGNYAFVLNVQGRILFDINLFIRPDSIWIDLDRRFVETAKKHFSKYTITERVTLADRTAEFSRLGLIGGRSDKLLVSLGVGNATAMASLAQAVFPWRDTHIGLIRHDFCGPLGFELFVPSAFSGDFKTALLEGEFGQSIALVSAETVEVLRVEAGIPWPGHEITDEYLPAETRQLDRAVNYQKGCYLGQEVVERMRSRAVVARQLVGLRLDAPFSSQGEGRGEERPQVLDPEGKPIGQVTSSCHSPMLGCPIALAYVKTALSSPGSRLTVSDIPATVVDLPFRSSM